ncbi:MAG TPA: leucine-rich repeat domain-containing protein [Verrucomicrobiae bacterium]
MKTPLGLTVAALGLALFHIATLRVQAQFTYSTNNGVIIITGYYGPGGDVIIPSTINGLPVGYIRDKAFLQHRTITSIAIPEGVTGIGNKAFYHCTGLRSVTIPGSAGSLGGWLFCSCFNLASATIGNGVTRIGYWEFFWCTSLTEVTIPDSVTSILDGAFYHCSSLTSVTVGKNVARIGPSAFTECGSLTGVFFKGNAPSADASVFAGATNATVYYLPGTTGWGPTFYGRPTAPWQLPNPVILNNASGAQAKASSFAISWATNKTVVIEATTDLVHPVWSPVGTNTLTGGSSYFKDPEGTKYPSRFYRIRSL